MAASGACCAQGDGARQSEAFEDAAEEAARRELRVGDRVVVRGKRGCVRYLGQLDGEGADVWVGIQWDDYTRGRHDGALHGRRYFHCESKQYLSSEAAPCPNLHTAASFVRLRKVQTVLSVGDALLERYTSSAEDGAPRSVLVAAASAGTLLSQRSCCTLSNMDVRTAAEGDGKVAPALEELELRSCLVARWGEDVRKILAQFSRLRALDISDNVLCTAEGGASPTPQACASLRTLVLNHTRIDGADLRRIAQQCTSLRALHVRGNALATVSEWAAALPPTLEWLDVSKCGLERWKQLSKLIGALPRLHTLNAADNLIEHIQCDGGVLFQQPVELNLDRNPLREWRAVSALARALPQLRSLRLAHTQLVEISGGADGVREGVIARVASLVVLNGGVVSADERLDAEKRFLSDQLSRRERGDTVDDNARIHALQERFAAFAVAQKTSRPAHMQTISKSSIQVILTCDDTTVTKSVPQTMKVEKLRLLCAKVFRLRHGCSLTLVAGDSDNDAVSTALDDGSRALNHYNMSESVNILVHSRTQ